MKKNWKIIAKKIRKTINKCHKSECVSYSIKEEIVKEEKIVYIQ